MDNLIRYEIAWFVVEVKDYYKWNRLDFNEKLGVLCEIWINEIRR